MKKKLNSSLLLHLGILLLFLCGCGAKKVADNRESRGFCLSDSLLALTALDTVDVEPVRSLVQLTGKVTIDPAKVANIYPVAGGVVLSVNAEIGDFVRAGQVLAVIRSGEIAQLQADLAEDQADLAIAIKNQSVAEDLFRSQLVSEKDVLSAREQVEKVRIRVRKMEELLLIYNAGKESDYTVRAPISGYVIAKKIAPNMQLRSDNMDAIFSLSGLDEVWVLGNVYETDISRVHEGMEARIQLLSYPDKIIYGKVDKVFETLDAESRTLKARVRLANPERLLKPEMFAGMQLVVYEPERLPTVSSDAVVFLNNRYYVVVWKDKCHLTMQPIDIKSQVGEKTYLRSGLTAGQVVVNKSALLVLNALMN